MAVGQAQTTTGPNRHHKTGTRLEPPKGSAGEAVQTRIVEDTELRTYGISSQGEAKHKAQDRRGWKAVVKVYVPDETKRTK